MAMRIPNNIDLNERSPLSLQMQAYQIKFHHWWRQRGPGEFLEEPMSLRVPTGGTKGVDWTQYKVLAPSEFRWGIYLAPADQETVAFGDRAGEKVWTSVPDEYRKLLLEHIVAQGDVENAAVEQSKALTLTVPSRHDLENVFQFFLEEGRHTWAMSHLLIDYFGAQGLVEAEGLLQRMSGDTENPRLLNAFNYHTEDWLSHFMWACFADRVGKCQIQAVTASAFQPLARAARYMMLEEPLHIKFGVDGLGRVLYRSLEKTLATGRLDVFEEGAVPLSVFQKYLNYWLPKIYDLFGNDISRRSHTLYAAGIRSPRSFDPQRIGTVAVDTRQEDTVITLDVAPELSINTVMRRQYIGEIKNLFDRWNRHIKDLGIDFKLLIPHERFYREIGPCRGLAFDLEGRPVDDGEAYLAAHLPSTTEIAQMREIMQRELDPEQVAGWIAPPGAKLADLQAA